MILYTSDHHFNHARIIEFARRPYASVQAMNEDLGNKLYYASAACNVSNPTRIMHCGDLAMNFRKFLEERGTPLTQSPAGHVCVLGNHDQAHGTRVRAYLDTFEIVVGNVKTWAENAFRIMDVLDGVPVAVLVSHAPQQNLQGCDYNVHGHLHNSMHTRVTESHHPEYDWSFESPNHFNASVELHWGAPRSLAELRAAHQANYSGRWRG